MIRATGGLPRPSAEAADRELEADVMRFVAILALCIVAISSLVEDLPAPAAAPSAAAGPTAAPVASIAPIPPMAPASPASSPASAADRAGDAVPITPAPAAEAPATEAPAAPPHPSRTDAPRPAPEATRPAPPARAEASAAEPAAAPVRPATAAEPRGFTLRFASDAALLRLVAGGTADVYAFAGADTLRLRLGAAGPEFVPAAGPARFHAIADTTVPAILRRALREAGRGPDGVVWGVTLPSATRAELARLIGAHRAGELVIDERGRVSLEAPDA